MQHCRLLTGIGLALVAAPVLAGSYGFLNRVEGPVDLEVGRLQSSVEATANYPIQVGDHLRTGGSGRLEAILPDSSLVRAGGNTELRFNRIAGSLDSNDTETEIDLLQGNLQLETATGPSEPFGTRIDTANATVRVLARGSYRIFTDGRSWTQVIVRSGIAEASTAIGSVQVMAGQQALIDGRQSPRIVVEAAPPMDSLEIWGADLSRQARAGSHITHVAPELHYAAAPLLRHGRWLGYGNSMVWRPHAPPGWRPYHAGWWIHTPSGLTWVSTEPWGWITYHYGYWWNVPGSGWVWIPGPIYTPGAVDWYWGPTHVGWYPAWPGGRYRMPGNWQEWTFCRTDRFGYRDSHRHLATGRELAHRGVFAEMPPLGMVTDDTRVITPDLWDRPHRIPQALDRGRSGLLGSSREVISGGPLHTDTPGWSPPTRDSRSPSGLGIRHQPGPAPQRVPGLRLPAPPASRILPRVFDRPGPPPAPSSRRSLAPTTPSRRTIGSVAPSPPGRSPGVDRSSQPPRTGARSSKGTESRTGARRPD